MCAGGNLDGAFIECYANQSKAHNQHVGRQYEVWRFGKQRALIVNVGFLILGPSEGYVTAPLIGNHPGIHYAVDDTQHVRIEEELRSETGWLKWHGLKLAVWSTVRFLVMLFQVVNQSRPECLPAGVYQWCVKMRPEYAKAIFLLVL
jgi:hypothetical protein